MNLVLGLSASVRERERVCVCLSVSEFGHVDMGAVKRNSFELGFRLGLGGFGVCGLG